MKKTIFIGAALLLLACVCRSQSASIAGEGRLSSPRSNAGYGSDAYNTMAQELCESTELPAGSKIAVMPFTYGKEKGSDVGMMVSERLTTRIVKLRKFKVIERQMLDNVISELHLEGTGVVDAETAKKLGSVLGVEAIITGTVLDLNVYQAEINARVIKTDTAEVMASSSVEIPNTWSVKSDANTPAPTYREPEQKRRRK